MAKLQLSSPWVEYYHKVEAMFKNDLDVRVIFDEDIPELKLFVEDPYKAAALTDLMPEQVGYGNVVLAIKVIPANGTASGGLTGAALFDEAFRRNPAYRYSEDIRGVFPNPITFVVFANEVVQYFNDNLFDVNGVCSTLYQDIAKEIFEVKSGVYYCTDKPASVNVHGAPCQQGRYNIRRR